MRGKHALFRLVVRNSFARFVRWVFARGKLLTAQLVPRTTLTLTFVKNPPSICHDLASIFRPRIKGTERKSTLEEKSLFKVPAMGFPCGLEGCPKTVEGQCSGCKKIHYCSREHQTRDWKRHRKDCKVKNSACPRFHEEYRKAFPAHHNGFSTLSSICFLNFETKPLLWSVIKLCELGRLEPH